MKIYLFYVKVIVWRVSGLKDNPQTLVSEFSPLQIKKKHGLTCVLHQHAFTLCTLLNNGISIKVSLKNLLKHFLK